MSFNTDCFDPANFDVGLFRFLMFQAEKAKDAKLQPGAHLQTWIKYQNSCAKKRKDGTETDLTDNRIKVLNHINFPWILSDAERWEKRYGELVEFEEKNGHCNVPRTNKNVLGEWVSTQRKEKKKYDAGKKTSLTAAKIERLESIGFVWNRKDWSERYDKLTHL